MNAPHALALEHAFEDLQIAFSRPSSTRYRLAALERWISKLRLAESSARGVATAEPYLLEWAGEIAELSRRLVPDGLDPDRITCIADLLEHACRASETLRREELLTDAVVRLRRAAASQIATVEQVDDGLPGARGSAGIYVPVVESAPGEIPDHFVPGLRLLRMEIFGTGPNDDVIRFDPPSIDTAADAPGGMPAALQAARRLLHAASPGARGTRVSARFVFSEPEVIHSGASHGLAAAVLYVAAVARHVESRTRFEPQEGLAVTGDVAADGRVLPVAPESLGMKVSAAFFSPVHRMVVPAEHLAAARRHADALARRYPLRKLEILGVSTLEEVFFDRRLTREVRRSPVTHAAAWAWKRKFSVTSLAIIATLAWALWWALTPPKDLIVVSASREGTELTFRNRWKRVLHTVKLDPDAVEQYMRTRDRMPLVAFGDRDGDGRSEVCYYTRMSRSRRMVPVVRCDVAGSARDSLVVPLLFDSPFPSDPQIVARHYLASAVYYQSFAPDSSYRLLVVASHNSAYPGLALSFDPESGRELGRYLHTGAIMDSRLADLQADGVPELVLTGINNALAGPFLAVLDPERLSGTSVTSPDRWPESYRPGTELAYVYLGPPSRLGEEYVAPAGRTGRYINIDYDEGLVGVTVNDALVYLDGAADQPTVPGRPQVGNLVYIFNQDIELATVVSSSEWDWLNLLAVEQGHLERPMSKIEVIESSRSAIRYWDGAHWHDTPWTRLKPRARPSLAAASR